MINWLQQIKLSSKSEPITHIKFGYSHFCEYPNLTMNKVYPFKEVSSFLSTIQAEEKDFHKVILPSIIWTSDHIIIVEITLTEAYFKTYPTSPLKDSRTTANFCYLETTHA